MGYLLLKWLHILAAITLIGAHITYGVWIVRGSSHPEALPFTLRNVKWLDTRISVPAYGVLLATGAAMSSTVRAWLTAPWLLAGWVLFVLVFAAHLIWYSPVLKKMIDLLDREGLQSGSFQDAAAREMKLGIALTVLMVLIVFLMTVKPRLWI